MKQYEYKTLKLDFNLDVAEQLNKTGKEGWRLVPASVFNSAKEVLLEREKEKN